MGLISYFKDLYYNNRFNKAEELLNEGNAPEAEKVLLSILDKHPQAACRLASYYYTVGNEASTDVCIEMFKKAVELKSKSGMLYEKDSYELVLKNFSIALFEKGKSCFDSAFFIQAESFLNALNESEYKTKKSVTLGIETNINIILGRIESETSTDVSFLPDIDKFGEEWRASGKTANVKKIALDYVKRLNSKERYFSANKILSSILNDEKDSRILDNAVNVVYGKDSEASPEQIRQTVAKYGASIVLRDSIDVNTALSVFSACWDASNDGTFVMSIFKSCRINAIRDALVSNVITNHSSFFQVSSLFSDFCRWISVALENAQALNIYEDLKTKGYDVEGFYVSKVHSWIDKLPYDERVSILNRAHSIYPKSSTIILDKFLCAQWFLNRGDNKKAISVADSILQEHSDAVLIKAKALCGLANKENHADEKIKLLQEASKVIGSCSEGEYKDVRKLISTELINASSLYYQNGNHDKCYSILHKLASQGDEVAINEISTHRFNETRSASSAQLRLQISSNAISELKLLGVPRLYNVTNYKNLWAEYINAAIETKSELKNEEALDFLESLRADINSSGLVSTEILLVEKPLVKEIIRRKYLVARGLELADCLDKAAQQYREISLLEASKTPTLSSLRFIICKLKTQNAVDILQHKEMVYTLLNNAASAYKSEKEDVAYRFALTLLKSGEDKEALQILEDFLPNESFLKKACLQGAMIKAQAKLDDFNAKLDAVKNRQLSSADTLFFINHMLEYAEVINPILPIPRSTLGKYRNKLKNYAIYKLFDEGKFDVAFEKLVKEHQDYLDDLTSLRNIALVCLNMAESKQISSENFLDVISVWLTAIYQERLFIKSLDYTSWDDQFTFSLYDAYGHFSETSIGDTPDNVVFDDSDDNNVVFIKDVQRALLDRFEAAIADNQVFHDFYTQQKDAMDAFIALNLDEKCRLVAPFLAKRDEDVFDGISSALETDRKQEYDNWEDVLSVGSIYQMDEPIYHDYSRARLAYANCITAINEQSYSDCKESFRLTNIGLIKRFDKLDSALTSFANSKVSALFTKDKADFKSNFDLYFLICSALKDSTLSFAFSNYVISYIVDEVNESRIAKYEAADFILSVYSLDSNNQRVKNNLSTLFEMLTREKGASSKQAVTTILSKVKAIDTSFYNTLNNEYEQAMVNVELNEIVDKVNSGTMTKAAALNKVYSIYSSKPNNSRVCENLATLCDMCIMEYVIGDEYGSYNVRSTLDKLKNNMSHEFKKHKSTFQNSYNLIWNQIPFETQLLLMDSPLAYGKTLNNKGLALKAGLGYYKSLGEC